VELREARDATGVEAEAIRSLIKSYLAELYSLTGEGDPSSTEYAYLPSYWSEVGRRAFVVEDQAEVVGFVLIRTPESTGTDDWEVAEFYIRPDARRRGLGVAAALEIWGRHPGSWLIEVSPKNRGAVEFWERAAQRALGASRNPPVPALRNDGRLVYRLLFQRPPN